MENTLSKRLQESRVHKKLTQIEVYKRTGIHNKTLSGYENGVSEPDSQTLSLLANLYQVSTDYLHGITTDPTSSITSQQKAETKKTPEQLLEEFKDFPEEMPVWLKAYQATKGDVQKDPTPFMASRTIQIMGTVRCGPNGIAFEEPLGKIAVDGIHGGELIALKCKGDSMTGMGIFDGDIAIVRRQPTVESGELAVVILNDEEGTLKRVHLKNDLIILESANPQYPQRFIEDEELKNLHIIGRVMQVIKKY